LRRQLSFERMIKANEKYLESNPVDNVTLREVHVYERR
jgi:hypothetical protein